MVARKERDEHVVGARLQDIRLEVRPWSGNKQPFSLPGGSYMLGGPSLVIRRTSEFMRSSTGKTKGRKELVAKIPKFLSKSS